MTTAMVAVPVVRAAGQTAPAASNAPAPCSWEQPPSCPVAADAAGHKNVRRPAVPECELAELVAQVELHIQRIVENETSVLDDYWLLGRLLERVRGNFRRGTWLPWLDRRGIDHTRAKRARLLTEVFASAEELRGLVLHQALRIARERKKGQERRAEPDVVKQLHGAIKKLVRIAGTLAEEEASQEYAPLARELAKAAAAICRTCVPKN